MVAAVRGGSLFVCVCVCWWLLSSMKPGLLVLTPWYEGSKVTTACGRVQNPPIVCNVLNMIKRTSVQILLFRLWNILISWYKGETHRRFKLSSHLQSCTRFTANLSKQTVKCGFIPQVKIFANTFFYTLFIGNTFWWKVFQKSFRSTAKKCGHAVSPLRWTVLEQITLRKLERLFVLII